MWSEGGVDVGPGYCRIYTRIAGELSPAIYLVLDLYIPVYNGLRRWRGGHSDAAAGGQAPSEETEADSTVTAKPAPASEETEADSTVTAN